jgi:HK97 family phage portal protein
VEQSLRLMSLLETAGIEQYRQPGMGKIALQISEAVGGSGVRAIQESFRTVHSGREGMTRPIVVQNGATVQQVGRSLVDQDWVNGRTQAIEDIARAFGVPPFVLFTGSDGMGAEESRLYGESLQGYTDSFGAEIAAKLYPEESVSVRFDVTRIMRGTFTESMSAYKEAVQLGVMTPNEVRKEMGLPPIEGGDEMYVGPNMETTKESSDDDSEDEPGPDPSEDGGAGDDLGED